MRLLRIPQPFDHPDFIFEPKIDGFRALAHVTGHHCELVSRNIAATWAPGTYQNDGRCTREETP
jgi:hypothetical protein